VSYLSLTDADREAMLATIGVDLVDALFSDIPESVRFQRELDLEPALPEAELVAHLEELASRNVDTGRELSFLGAGIFKQASWEEAIADLQHAVEFDPGRIYHRLELAEVYADRKQWDDARGELARLDALPDREILDPLYRARAAELARRIADKR